MDVNWNIKSYCVCQENGSKNTDFKLNIAYKNEKVFKNYEGILIYKCLNCGVLKTIPDKNVKLVQESRFEYYEKNKKKFVEIFKPIVETIKKYKKNVQVLDVGCSSGILLEMLKRQGFNIYGLEPDKKAYIRAKKKFKNKIFNCKLQDFLRTNRLKFDVIIYNHVLEHIQNPIIELKLVKKALKSNGIFVLGLPNTSNIFFWLRKKYWESLMPNEHIWHFSKKQIIKLLKRNRYKVIDVNFSNDKRLDYSYIKRMYFSFLSLINNIFKTGESILIVCKKV
jgi:2-polyprenyl-3-methyl-5-hydroxy-6-metoxy-1,4-benzoquinol methylase